MPAATARPLRGPTAGLYLGVAQDRPGNRGRQTKGYGQVASAAQKDQAWEVTDRRGCRARRPLTGIGRGPWFAEHS
jgi:hypothetical protein